MSNELTTTGGGDAPMVITQARPAMTFADMVQLAQFVAKSGMYAMKTPEQAMVLMQLCQAKGLHPIQAVEQYHIIQNRPAMRADAMQAEFQRRGGRVEWTEYTEKSVSAIFSHPVHGSLEVQWTLDDAKQAGLLNKDTWRSYPRQMLANRVISEGIRRLMPEVVVGVYNEEETEGFTAAPSRPGAYGSSPLIEGAPVNLPEPAQITSAPNPPAPAPSARKRFALEARRLNLPILDDGKYSIHFAAKVLMDALEYAGLTAPASDIEITEEEWERGTRALVPYSQHLDAQIDHEPEMEAEEPAEEVVTAKLIQEGEPLDLPELEDPFAETVAPARAPSYAEHETTARGKRK